MLRFWKIYTKYLMKICNVINKKFSNHRLDQELAVSKASNSPHETSNPDVGRRSFYLSDDFDPFSRSSELFIL